MDRSTQMGSAPVGKLLWDFSVPATASMLVSAIYSLTDRIFIGQGTGVEGIAAATAAYPSMVIGMAVGLLFSIGVRSVASIALGAGNDDRAREAVSRGTAAAFLATAAVSLLLWLFSRPLLSLFGAGPRIAEDARIFLQIVLIGLPFQSAALTATTALQVQGRPRTSFFLNLAGTALNVILAPLFIFAFHWGLVGAASATALSQIASLVMVLFVVQGERSTLKIDLKRLNPWKPITLEEAGIGLPVFLVNFATMAVLIVANNAVRPYGGDLALAVIGVVNTISLVASYPLYGVTNGAQPLFGYNYGAGNWLRIRQLARLVGFWTLVFAVTVDAAAVIAPRFIVGLFNSDPGLLDLGGRGLRIFMIAFAFFPLGQLPTAYFQATGRALPPAILLLSRNLVMIVGMLILPHWLGFDGVCLAGPLADVTTAAIGVFYLMVMQKEIGRGERGEKAVESSVA
jgi:putative MATE family efflux protein